MDAARPGAQKSRRGYFNAMKCAYYVCAMAAHPPGFAHDHHRRASRIPLEGPTQATAAQSATAIQEKRASLGANGRDRKAYSGSRLPGA